jgi:COP9 signalosome complex subunit 1
MKLFKQVKIFILLYNPVVFLSSSFKHFLELEPQIRDILFKFYESKYAICLKLMDQIKDHLALDMYLAPHINTIYSWIRQRSLRQVKNEYTTHF